MASDADALAQIEAPKNDNGDASAHDMAKLRDAMEGIRDGCAACTLKPPATRQITAVSEGQTSRSPRSHPFRYDSARAENEQGITNTATVEASVRNTRTPART